MKYLLLGTVVPNRIRDSFISHGVTNDPGDMVQKYIIEELSYKKDVSIISSPRIEWYPKCKIKRVKKQSFTIGDVQGFMTGFLNIGVFSQIFRKNNFIHYCRKWAQINQKADVRIIVYSMNSTFLKAAKTIKSIIPKARICLIVPDLPTYMSNYKWPISLLKKIDILRIEKLRRIVDFYSLYCYQMACQLKLKPKECIVTEGFVNRNKINLIKKESFHSKKICLYAGDLKPIYGIQTMIDAFATISVSCELHIYGKKELIGQYNLNKNVKYMGMLSPEEVFEKMKESDLLINPRPSSLELAQFSFPSKTFEYMASGTPCVMCNLPGLSSDFLPYIYIFEDETVEGFQKTIETILNKTDCELAEKGNEAAIFLLENKTTNKQMQ